MGVAKCTWTAVGLGISGFVRIFIFMFCSFLAMEIGGAFNSVIAGHNWLNTKALRASTATAETAIILLYYSSNMGTLSWHCVSGNIEAARKTIISLTNTGAAMSLLFWIFHVLAGGGPEIDFALPERTKDTILASNVVLASFCVRCAWLLYRKSYSKAVRSAASALIITPMTGVLTALSTMDPDTIHEFAGPASGG